MTWMISKVSSIGSKDDSNKTGKLEIRMTVIVKMRKKLIQCTCFILCIHVDSKENFGCWYCKYPQIFICSFYGILSGIAILMVTFWSVQFVTRANPSSGLDFLKERLHAKIVGELHMWHVQKFLLTKSANQLSYMCESERKSRICIKWICKIIYS